VAAVSFRSPTVTDGAALWRLARDSGALDLNSPYYYLAFCARFAESSIVAEDGGQVLGFVTGLLHPDPATLFVWQVGVDASARGRGIASGMLEALLARDSCDGVRRLDTTVTPSNEASLALFRGLARRWGARVEESPFLQGEDFPPEDRHEPERLLSIAPLERRRAETGS
jgi:L-2,4-diaminobutyric acid acetyltransferase